MGFSVVELELHNPVRLAIQTALVDNISRGRLVVGLGRGSRYNVFEYKGFGTTMEAGRDHLEEAEDLLIKAWTTDNVDYDGQVLAGLLPIYPAPPVPEAPSAPRPRLRHSRVRDGDGPHR